MGKRGPAKKPAGLVALAGNPSGRPLPPEPMEAPLFSVPKPPAWLRPEAKKEWMRLGTLLLRMQVLTQVDLAAFEAVCQSYATWVESQKQIKKKGMLVEDPSGNLIRNPWHRVGVDAYAQWSRGMAQFGLTPSARIRGQGDGTLGVGDGDSFTNAMNAKMGGSAS